MRKERTVKFNDAARSAFDGEDTSKFEDNV